MTEFGHIGRHCSVCNTLDYLPVTCTFCELIFCKDHGASILHRCTPEIEVKKDDLKNNRTTSIDFVKCHFCSSSVPILETSNCYHCRERFCLKHRQQVDHDCQQSSRNELEDAAKFVQIEVRKNQVKEILKSLSSGVQLKAKGAKNSDLARKVALMRLKSKAVGESSIPFEERMFFFVDFVPNDNSFDQGPKAFRERAVFLCREWSIGKAVDWLASKFELINKNNDLTKPSLILTTDSILGAAATSSDENGASSFCCDKKSPFFCFEHRLKDLSDEQAKTMLSGDTLTLTYFKLN